MTLVSTPRIAIAVALQVLDLITFWMAVQVYGIHGESNGVMAALYQSSGIVGVAMAKGAIVAIALFLSRFLPNGQNGTQRLANWLLIAISAIAAFGIVTNLLVVVLYI